MRICNESPSVRHAYLMVLAESDMKGAYFTPAFEIKRKIKCNFHKALMPS